MRAIGIDDTVAPRIVMCVILFAFFCIQQSLSGLKLFVCFSGRPGRFERRARRSDSPQH